MTRTAIVVAVLSVPGLGWAQTATSGVSPGRPGQTMVRAAGMPLRDGALPPGVLTVRVVRGTFSSNLPNQTVTIDELGGKIRTEQTGPDGRARIAHVPVGAGVRVAAVVDGERLESDLFEMPGESGVRILLIAGADAPGDPAFAASLPDVAANAPPAQVPAAAASTSGTRTRLPLAGILALLAVAGAAAIVGHRARRAPGPPVSSDRIGKSSEAQTARALAEVERLKSQLQARRQLRQGSTAPRTPGPVGASPPTPPADSVTS